MQTLEKPIRFLSFGKLNPSYPLLIFLPGMDGASISLQAQLDGLESAFDIRCLTLAPDDKTNWDGLVNQVVALVQDETAYNPNRLVYLCGESFGACLALKLVIQFPDLFESLILINPASSFSKEPWRRLMSGFVKQMPVPLYALVAVGLVPFLALPHRVSSKNRQALVQAIQAVTPESVAWRLSLLCNFRLDEASLTAIDQSVLLIAGAADQILPSSSEVKRLATVLPNARKVILPHSGHACLLESDIKLHKVLSSVAFLPKS